MIVCGITGHTGNLGKKFIKTFKEFKYIKLKGDITNKKNVTDWVSKGKFDIILHFASIVPTVTVNENYKRALRVNYNGTKILVDAITKYNKKLDWFFFSSTSHVYQKSNKKLKESDSTKPTSKYGSTKLKAEKYIVGKLTKNNIKYCIGRIFSISDNKNENFLIPNLLKKINNNKKEITFNNLNHYRDFLNTSKISKIINLLREKKFVGVINIASGQETCLKDLATFLSKKKGKEVVFNDNKINTKIIANINKLNKLKWKTKKLNFFNFFD